MSEQINSVDFWVEELTKDTSGFNVSDVYNDMTPDIRNGYGQWMWNCGYNAGLFNLQAKVNTYCVPQYETTTFKPITTDARGYARQFSCSACNCAVIRTHYMRPDQFDYNYCPYCGRPVESGDDAE